MAEPLSASVVEKFLEDYLAKMGEKLAKGDKLTTSEINLLLVATTQRDNSRIYSRIDEVKLDIDKRIDVLDKKVDDVRVELLGRIDDLGKMIDDTNRRVDDVKADLSGQRSDLKS